MWREGRTGGDFLLFLLPIGGGLIILSSYGLLIIVLTTTDVLELLGDYLGSYLYFESYLRILCL